MEEIHEIEMHEGEGKNTVTDVKTTANNYFEKITPIELVQLEKAETRNKEGRPKQKGGQDRLQILVQQRLNALDTDPPLCIFRVPPFLREKRKYMYEPGAVSIGPYYHGRSELQMMEEHKWRCLHDFLSRNKNISVDVYLQAMRALEILARRCYSESVKMSSDDFIMMLLLDGCFILQFYHRPFKNRACDALFRSEWHTIFTDLLLLENQIPFFVIHKLAFLSSDYESHTVEECHILKNFFSSFPNDNKMSRKPDQVCCDKVDHLLHFYYKCMIPELDKINPQRTQPPSTKTSSLSSLWSRHPSQTKHVSCWCLFPRATVLHESGVTFRRKKNPRHMFDITFNDGVMEIPPMIICDVTMILFTTIVSYEQSHGTVETTFSIFITLMDLLIDTEDDAILLKKCGIIESLLQSDRNDAAVFNGFGEGIILNQEHYFASLFQEVHKYSNSTWPKHRARLTQDYFSNPWTAISVFAGVMLLGLAVTQTYYTAYSAYNH